ncbi:hypothetical protein OAE23_02005 [Synechococcus sp. AH-551-E11]|nr:hypothetical protein [Synechococcus sp. AH-551-E11]
MLSKASIVYSFYDQFKYLPFRLFAFAVALHDQRITNVAHWYSSIFFPVTAKLLRKLKYFKMIASITADGKNLLYTVKNNSGFETIRISDISLNVKILPKEKFCYVVIPESYALRQIQFQKFYFQSLYFLSSTFSPRNSDIRSYINSSLNTLSKAISFGRSSIKESKYTFSPSLQESIQYSENILDKEISLSYKNCIILKSHLGFLNDLSTVNDKILNQTQKKADILGMRMQPKKIFIFYIDNISFGTGLSSLGDLGNNSLQYLSCKYKLSFSKFVSTSNWTFPAALSMFSMSAYWKHKIYHPCNKPYYSVNALIGKSIQKSQALQDLLVNYKASFVCGSNWRMNMHHGLNSIFSHGMNNPGYTDIYDVFSQSVKQIDVAKGVKSLHWINVMDAHHPVKGSVLPIGSFDCLPIDKVKLGLDYETGPKSEISNTDIPSLIYKSQISSSIKAIDSILEYSLKSTPLRDHLIVFVSDHGSNFPTGTSTYSKIYEKHTPIFAASSSYLWNCLGGEDVKFSDHRFAHHSLFDFIAFISGVGGNDLFKKSFLSNISLVIFPGKPYEFIYLDDASETIYHFISKLSLPLSLQSSRKIKSFWLDLYKKCDPEDIWCAEKNHQSDQINYSDVPDYVLRAFDEILRDLF